MPDRFTAFQADVEWRANTGKAEVDVERLRREFHSATQDMSTQALRAASAQERLDRALIKHGPSSDAARRAEVNLRQETERATAAANRHAAAVDRDGRAIAQLGRGALAGSARLHGLARTVAFASTSFIGAYGLTAAIRTSIEAASNLNEQTTKTETVFGAASAQVIDFADHALGLARDRALETASSIGALLKPIGLVGDDAAKTSIRLTKLGVDLSSFYNTSVEDALAAIRSGLVGESEPLRRYGVLLSEARVQAEALRETGKKQTSDLTAQEKVLARISLIFKDAQRSGAVGDYQKTIGGLANQQRELAKNVRNTEILLGQALIPQLNQAVKSLNAFLGKEENQKRIQRDVTEGVRIMAGAFEAFAAAVELGVTAGEKFQAIWSQISRLFGDAANKGLVDIIKGSGSGNEALQEALDRAIREAATEAGLTTPTGEDVAQRGAAARARRRAAAGRGGGAGGGAGAALGGLSLPGQLSRAELALAKARAVDDVQAERAALVEETRVLRAEIASKKAKFRDKTALYNQLAQVEDAIDSIDEARRQKEEERAKAREDRARRARERRKERARREARELVEEMRYIKDIDRERSILIQQNIASYGGQVLAKKAGIAGTGNLFSEARDEFNTYGSNIAGRNGVLSGQDARALQALLTLVELAREGNQHTKATAKAVHVTAKSTPQEITIARALAHQGL